MSARRKCDYGTGLELRRREPDLVTYRLELLKAKPDVVAAHQRLNQALRGSSEFHAWGDSNLYLRRHGDQLALAVEHRAAASITAVSLQLAIDGDVIALAATEHAVAAEAPAATPATLADKIEAQLAGAAAPLSAAALRKLCRVRNASLTAVLADLVAAGRIRRDATGYVISH